MNAQDILQTIFEDDSSQSNETLELFKFLKNDAVPLSRNQIHAIMLLAEYEETSDLIDKVLLFKSHVNNQNLYFKLLDKLTMADRIKGNAKLSHLMKASANPAQTLKPEDLQAKGFKRSEIDR